MSPSGATEHENERSRRARSSLAICGAEERGWPSPVASRHPLPPGEGEQ